MPSRAAHRAALQRTKEPSLVAPDGVTLPELPEPHAWRNPVHGDCYDRGEWEIYRVEPGGSVTVARVRASGAESYAVDLRSAGVTESRTCGPEAFDVAAAWCREYHPRP